MFQCPGRVSFISTMQLCRNFLDIEFQRPERASFISTSKVELTGEDEKGFNALNGLLSFLPDSARTYGNDSGVSTP